MSNNPKILIYGTGAIGSIFAGKLAENGYDVTVLARGKRLSEIYNNGIILVSSISKRKLQANVKIIEILNDNDIYDYIIVTVQITQIDAILTTLSKNKSPNIVFVVNNCLGYQKWIDAVGYERILIGFPSAFGERKDDIVKYFIGTGLAKIFQATSFAELNNAKSERLLKLIQIFKNSGFSPNIETNMDAWQKTHVAVIVPLTKGLEKLSANNLTLLQSYNIIKETILTTRDYLNALKAINIEITPHKLKFYYLPLCILIPVIMIIVNTKIAKSALSNQSMTSKEEMTALESQFLRLVKGAGYNPININIL